MAQVAGSPVAATPCDFAALNVDAFHLLREIGR